MPLEVSIDTGKDLVTRIGRGLVTADEFVESLEDVVGSPEYHPGMKSLTDLRDTSHELVAEDIRRIAENLVTNRERHVDAKAAIVVSKAVSYGMSRMLQIHLDLEGMPLAFSVFYDMDEAREWLGVA
jgi:hypothetical protein